jgi:hypothetical protein
MPIMKKIFFTTILLCCAFTIFSQQRYGDYKKAYELDLKEFYSKLSNLKYVELESTNDANDYSKMLSIIGLDYISVSEVRDFITFNLGLKNLTETKLEKEASYKECESFCNIAKLHWSLKKFESVYGLAGHIPMTFEFIFCDSSYSKFSFYYNVNLKSGLFQTNLQNSLIKNIYPPSKKINQTTLSLKQNDTFNIKNTNDIKDDFLGVYKILGSNSTHSFEEIEIAKNNEQYLILNIKNRLFKKDWLFKEKMGVISKTSSEKAMIGTIQNNYKKDENITISIINNNQIEINYYDTNEKITLIKN